MEELIFNPSLITKCLVVCYLSLNYLIRDYAISHQSSASLMVRLKNKKVNKKARKQLLAIAPFSNGDLINVNRESTLNDLPYTKKELENLEELY